MWKWESARKYVPEDKTEIEKKLSETKNEKKISDGLWNERYEKQKGDQCIVCLQEKGKSRRFAGDQAKRWHVLDVHGLVVEN